MRSNVGMLASVSQQVTTRKGPGQQSRVRDAEAGRAQSRRRLRLTPSVSGLRQKLADKLCYE